MRKQKADLSYCYEEVCAHYYMTLTRKPATALQENGSIEDLHGHLQNPI
ncbi:hypothetical protein JET14_21050 (plasmid) [Martelella lutilitoris]|uniref:Transposase n=1 Tax=Martelella lutilitoris TaxID=2583532 RepID=A0A7T7KNU6_9HYPH|nr:hypothetical protein [Martelella lutilitoris]QQM32928.1 hypothetical protein JET14_21050 [Martelella lutilitoris]